MNAWSITVYRVKLLNFSTQNATLEVSFKVINPSAVEATIQNLNGSLLVNGTFIGNIYQQGVLAIPAHGYNILTLDMLLNNGNLGDELLSVVTRGLDAPIDIRITGTLQVSSGIKITVPIDDLSHYTLGSLIS